MPRIKQYADKYATEDFQKAVRICQGERDLMSKSALAERVGMPRTTLLKRLKEPEGMTFGEFRRLKEATGLGIGAVLPLLGYSQKEIKTFREKAP